MAPPDGTGSWLENDEKVVMRVNLCCEGGRFVTLMGNKKYIAQH
jgi:hypothetical protein